MVPPGERYRKVAVVCRESLEAPLGAAYLVDEVLCGADLVKPEGHQPSLLAVGVGIYQAIVRDSEYILRCPEER